MNCSRFATAFVVACTLAACGGGGSDGSGGAGGSGVTDDPITGAACDPAPSYSEDVSGCSPAATDYQPRDNNSANDTWPACISDDGTWHRIEQSVSSIARVAAYDAIGDMLWNNPQPTHEDFIDARILFEEDQGLGSRVARRYDVHYPKPSAGGCEDAGVAEANPDYCVGPATLQPLVVEAFADGSQGKHLVVNAAKIRAALQWFFYVSAIKEATTCTDVTKDCDSAWAYYTGGTGRDAPAGLAAEIDALAPETHHRAFDGVLAVRCWRDLDTAVPADDLALRDRAIDQLDRALVRGMAIIIRQHFASLECATGNYRAASFEALKILVPLFDRETRARDSTAADTLMKQVTGSVDQVDVTAAIDALESTYPCP